MEGVEILSGVIFPYINLIIYIAVAIFLFRKPLANMAKKRRDDFLKVKAEAEAAKLEAEQKLKEVNARLSNLDNEIANMKQRSFDQAKLESDRIIEDATRLADHLKKEAKSIVEAEMLAAKAELQNEVLKLVKANVTEKIQKEFDSDRQLQLVQRKTNLIQEMSRG